MKQQRPFRFGIINERMSTRQEWINKACEAEDRGYATFLLRDHFIREPFSDQFAPIVALMSAADATTSLRIGSLVLDNDYRHPAVLAKEAATLDVLSDGRFEMGLGAGWLREEYEQTGIAFDAPGIRISRMEETLSILKGLFTGEPVTYTGNHYTITNLTSFPRPLQRPHPPILIGGGGKRILSIAGREADIIGILNSSLTSGTLEDEVEGLSSATVEQKLEWIRQGAGARFPEIELSMVITLMIIENQHNGIEELARQRGWSGIATERILNMPSVFIGSAEQIAEQMLTRRERFGISYYIVTDEEMSTFAPVVRLLSNK
jgi:probable F420-dependent oxidoreductase